MNNKHLYLLLKEKIKKWRESGYPCSYPTITEVLEYSITSFVNEKSLRFLILTSAFLKTKCVFIGLCEFIQSLF